MLPTHRHGPGTTCQAAITLSTHLKIYRLACSARLRVDHQLFAVNVEGDKTTLVLVRAKGYDMAKVLDSRSQSRSPAPRVLNTSLPDAVDSTSSKLSTPEVNSDSLPMPPAKRQRISGNGIQDPRAQDPEPQDWEERITAVMDARPSYDDAVQQLLQRSIAVALQAVGFDTASKEAFEAISSEVDSYMQHFLTHVTQSMQSSRRSQITPLDFEYALLQEGLTAFQLKPHLQPPVPKELTLLHFDLEEPEELPSQTSTALLGPELSGAAEKNSRKYIPKNFPPFPPLHTWKNTEYMTHQRETDPRKIREKAAAEARQAEEALGRLMKPVLAKEYREVTARRALMPECKTMDDMWVEMVKDICKDKFKDPNVSQEDKDALLQPILIDPERTKYGMKLKPLRKSQEETITVILPTLIDHEKTKHGLKFKPLKKA